MIVNEFIYNYMDEAQMIQFFASKQDLADLEYKLKDEMVKHKDEIMTAMDEQTALLRRADQERVFTTEHIHRIEKRVESAEKDIKTVKARLAVA